MPACLPGWLGAGDWWLGTGLAGDWWLFAWGWAGLAGWQAGQGLQPFGEFWPVVNCQLDASHLASKSDP